MPYPSLFFFLTILDKYCDNVYQEMSSLFVMNTFGSGGTDGISIFGFGPKIAVFDNIKLTTQFFQYKILK